MCCSALQCVVVCCSVLHHTSSARSLCSEGASTVPVCASAHVRCVCVPTCALRVCLPSLCLSASDFQTYTHTYAHIHKYVSTHTCVRTYAHTHTLTHSPSRTHAHTSTHAHTHTLTNTHTHIHTRTRTHTLTHVSRDSVRRALVRAFGRARCRVGLRGFRTTVISGIPTFIPYT